MNFEAFAPNADYVNRALPRGTRRPMRSQRRLFLGASRLKPRRHALRETCRHNWRILYEGVAFQRYSQGFLAFQMLNARFAGAKMRFERGHVRL